MSENEFRQQSEAAMKFMKEMNARAGNKPMKNTNTQAKPNHSEESNIKRSAMRPATHNDFPFSELLKNKDTALILGLLLVLFSENADKKLLFALLYILM